MARRWTTAAAVLVLSAGLAGCGSADGSDGSDVPAAVREAASALPSDLASATAGDQDLDGEADADKAMTADELCGFLAEEKPEVIDLSPPEYAYATFGSALLGFYTEHGLLTDIDGADMDALVAEGCPDAAAELLPVLGADSFAALLSQ